ncbi:MAG TPA: hypothetical protein VK927_11825 [Adhaeribacter sp.]|nr:hypothetical protein [Adhaeribacter sp.]
MQANRYTFYFCCLLALCLPVMPAAAQTDYGTGPTYSRVWKIRPLQFGEIYLSYEKVKELDQTNEIGIGYIYKSFVGASSRDSLTGTALTGFYSNFLDEEDYVISDCDGIVVRMSQRNYPSAIRPAPAGFYYGPAFMYRFIAFRNDLLFDFPGEVVGRMYQHVLGFHYQVGYQAIVVKHLSLEVFGGLGARAKMTTARLSKGRVEERVIAPLKFGRDNNTVVSAAPSLHLNVSLGLAF